MSGKGVLSGVRIVEFAGIGPSPMAAMLLAELGAEVLRVDRTTKVQLGTHKPERFNLLYRSRRTIDVDLKAAEGKALALDLVAKADIVLEGFRPGVMERLGLGPDDCFARRPGLVYGRVTGWGQEGPLSAYAGHDIRVAIRAADLSSDAGWTEACEGMDYVQHIASPIPATLPNDADDLIVPAHDGALRVLKAAKAAGVKRVVMTSSMAAIAYGWGDKRPKLLTEEHWSDSGNLADNTAYTRSKTIAERAAWAYVNGEGKGLELTTINPAAVLGPVMSGDFSASVEILTQLLSGKLPGTPRVGFGIVDVRDVAWAHVLAMTNPAAAGERFLVCDKFMWFSQVADTLRGQVPPAYEKKLPKGELPGWVLKLMANFNPTVKQV
ncbi:MAG: hypothetical protein B7Z52_01515, partial [Burkholderiales bacterium 12-64-5]